MGGEEVEMYLLPLSISEPVGCCDHLGKTLANALVGLVYSSFSFCFSLQTQMPEFIPLKSNVGIA